MAEGWAKELRSNEFEIYSAGIEAHGLNPMAVKVMAEAGVDISSQQSNTLDELDGLELDLIITVCSHADKNCPVSIKTKTTHFGFDDPPSLAKSTNSEEEALEIYRRVRDEIKDFVSNLSFSNTI